MDKIWLIIKREYLTKVRKKAFLITTFIFPLLTGMLWLVPIWLAKQDSGDQKVLVVDNSESALFRNQYKKISNISFVKAEHELAVAKLQFKNEGYYGLLFIPKINVDQPNGIKLWTGDNPSFNTQQTIERIIEEEVEKFKLERAGIDQEVLAKSKTDINLETIRSNGKEETETNAIVSSVISYASGFIIYMIIFIYGVQVMKGVMEEKTSRIVEVIISSVKPFQLMMGKILGTVAVAFTQLFLWLILTLAVSVFATNFTSLGKDEIQSTSIEKLNDMEGKIPTAEMLYKFIIDNNIPNIVILFFVYFIGGYLLYSSLFAAIGSAIDNETDTQQFMFPVMAPLFFSIAVLSIVLKDPHGPLAFWMSIIPLTSPVVMMGRLPFDVPWWQILLSISLLIGGFVFTTWFAGRIYRVGILMYGKKVNYKELIKWFFVKM